MSDADLLERVVARDVGSLEELYRRHVGWIVGRLRRRCGDEDAVADALQDTFVAVWTGADRWNASGDVAAWMWGIASRRLVAAQRRRRTWSRWRTGRPADDGEPIEAVDGIDQMAGVDDRAEVADAVAALPAVLRGAVDITYGEGRTMDEAARALGIPTGTLKTRLRRARRDIAKRRQGGTS